MNEDQLKKLLPLIIIVPAVLMIGLFALVVFSEEDSNSSISVSTESSESGADTLAHDESDGHSHENEYEDGHGGTYEYSSHSNVPGVSITGLSEGSDGAWELAVEYSDFTIDEDAVDSENVPGVGHAHVYVNGEKTSRLFSESYIFEDDLKEGDVVRVALNTNDHKEYTHDGQALDSEFTVGEVNTDFAGNDEMDHDGDMSPADSN